MTSGTSGAIRWFFELETTACPEAASRASASPATLASSAEKRILETNAPSPGPSPRTGIDAAFAASGVARRHVAACAYGLPAERSDAASSTSSNQGWFARSDTILWPTAPVAPSTPTGIFFEGADMEQGIYALGDRGPMRAQARRPAAGRPLRAGPYQTLTTSY